MLHLSMLNNLATLCIERKLFLNRATWSNVLLSNKQSSTPTFKYFCNTELQHSYDTTMKRVAQSEMKQKWTMYNKPVQVLLGDLSHCSKIHGK